MNIIYFGNNLRGVECLKGLLNSKHEILAVVMHSNAPEDSFPDSIYSFVKRSRLRAFHPLNVNDPEFIREIEYLDPDLMILSGFNPILKKPLIKIPKKGVINLHGGRLPKYRGGSPINWQIINGEKQGACTILYVDEGIDTGDIIAEKLFDIGPDETAGEAINKTLEIFPKLLLETIFKIEKGVIVPKPQDGDVSSYYCKRYPQDGRIIWDQMTAVEVHNLVRALNGPLLPSAYTFLNGKKIFILRTELMKNSIFGSPGRIALIYSKGVVVIAQDRGLIIHEISFENSNKIFSAKDKLEVHGWTFDF